MRKLIIALIFIVFLYGCNSPKYIKEALMEEYKVEIQNIIGPINSQDDVYVIEKEDCYVVVEVYRCSGLIENEYYLTKKEPQQNEPYINVSNEIKSLIKDQYNLEYNDSYEVKGINIVYQNGDNNLIIHVNEYLEISAVSLNKENIIDILDGSNSIEDVVKSYLNTINSPDN